MLFLLCLRRSWPRRRAHVCLAADYTAPVFYGLRWRRCCRGSGGLIVRLAFCCAVLESVSAGAIDNQNVPLALIDHRGLSICRGSAAAHTWPVKLRFWRCAIGAETSPYRSLSQHRGGAMRCGLGKDMKRRASALRWDANTDRSVLPHSTSRNMVGGREALVDRVLFLGVVGARMFFLAIGTRRARRSAARIADLWGRGCGRWGSLLTARYTLATLRRVRCCVARWLAGSRSPSRLYRNCVPNAWTRRFLPCPGAGDDPVRFLAMRQEVQRPGPRRAAGR